MSCAAPELIFQPQVLPGVSVFETGVLIVVGHS